MPRVSLVYLSCISGVCTRACVCEDMRTELLIAIDALPVGNRGAHKGKTERSVLCKPLADSRYSSSDGAFCVFALRGTYDDVMSRNRRPYCGVMSHLRTLEYI